MKTAAFLYSSGRNFNFLEKTKTGSSSYAGTAEREKEGKEGGDGVGERVGCIHGIPPTRSWAKRKGDLERVYDIPPTVWFVPG